MNDSSWLLKDLRYKEFDIFEINAFQISDDNLEWSE